MENSDSSFGRMQEDAIRRVQEMQRRSREAVGAQSPQEVTESAPTAPTASLGGILKNLAIDEEKALIAMLIYILYKQGADIKLLVGLAYLIL